MSLNIEVNKLNNMITKLRGRKKHRGIENKFVKTNVAFYVHSTKTKYVSDMIFSV